MSLAGVLLSFVIYGAMPGGQWHSLYMSPGCGGRPDWSIGAFTASPSAAILVIREDEVRPQPRNAPWGHALVALKLSTGKELGRVPLQFGSNTPMDISADGSVVAVLRQPGGALWEPYELSVWRLASGARELIHIKVEKGDGPGKGLEIVPNGTSRVAISPHGDRVAFFGRTVGSVDDRLDAQGGDRIVIVDLVNGSNKQIAVPASASRPVVDGQLWWIHDGAELLVSMIAVPRRLSRAANSGKSATDPSVPSEREVHVVSSFGGPLKFVGSLAGEILGSDDVGNLLVRSNVNGSEGFVRRSVAALSIKVTEGVPSPESESEFELVGDANRYSLLRVFPSLSRNVSAVIVHGQSGDCLAFGESDGSHD